MKLIFTILFFGGTDLSFAQNVGVNATGAVPATSAMFDVVSSDKGLLIPRVDIVSLTDNASL